MGIGKAQGFEDGWIAGAIISGAYFGDKISPLSETTILASSITDTPLFRHIRYMMITTVPSLVITLIIFTVAGFSHDANNTQHIAEVATALNEKFHITPWLLIVPVATGILIAKKVPSIAVPVYPAGCCFCFDLSAGFVGRNFRNCRFRIRFTV
jgi:NhaC family Na+:H+ antiporter